MVNHPLGTTDEFLGSFEVYEEELRRMCSAVDLSRCLLPSPGEKYPMISICWRARQCQSAKYADPGSGALFADPGSCIFGFNPECDTCVKIVCVCVEPLEWSNCQCRLWFWSPSFFEYPGIPIDFCRWGDAKRPMMRRAMENPTSLWFWLYKGIWFPKSWGYPEIIQVIRHH